MKININASFSMKQKDVIKKRLGINPGGKVQNIIDASVISHMREKMPMSSEQHMIHQTYQVRPGLIIVDTPYAHYQNEGIKYVMPENGKSAFYSPAYGYWSKKGEKKEPTNEPLQYHSGNPNRGAHFVERTLNEDFKDILNDAQRGLGK